MPPSSKNFTDAEKAKIYQRDRATCCFSGANLWLLDAPLRTGWQSDWVDHRKPVSRGGTAKLENGVCASHTFNMKKRNNTADTTYLFEKGHPTFLYYDLFGAPPTAVVSRLQRLANLGISDWYFNRAVTWIFNALDNKWGDRDYKRTPDDWFNAAFKKLSIFQKNQKDSAPALEARGVIFNPNKHQEVILSIRHSKSPESMKRTALELFPDYKMNSDFWWDYFTAENDDARRDCYNNAGENKDRLDPNTFSTIQADFKIRHP